MPAHDTFHDLVVRLLIADGWTITDDPYRIEVGHRYMFVDLGAEKLIAAERNEKRIAVEIKSFGGPSEVHDLELALGQYMLYHPFMRAKDPGRLLYLAISDETLNGIFGEPVGQGLMMEYKLRLLVFDPFERKALQWTPAP